MPAVSTVAGKSAGAGRVAKVARKRRGEAEVVYNADPFHYLLNRFVKAKSLRVKDRIALELMPYVKPKLRSVDLNLSGQVKLKVTIGGQPTIPRAAEDVLDAVTVQ